MLTADIQKLEPGGQIRLYEVDGTAFGADVLRFHGHKIPHSADELDAYANPLMAGSTEWLAGDDTLLVGRGGTDAGQISPQAIWWQGREYAAWPVDIQGLEANADGSPPSPTLSVGNISGAISALCLAYDDMVQARVVIRETLAKYLDAQNFPEGNPDADPDQETVEIWYVDSKQSETSEVVTFRLSSPADVSGQRLPARQLTAYCHWCYTGGYRGPECGYTGSAMFTEDDEPTDNPALDQCSGTVRGCELRFGEFNELPFGGFPAVSLIRR